MGKGEGEWGTNQDAKVDHRQDLGLGLHARKEKIGGSHPGRREVRFLKLQYRGANCFVFRPSGGGMDLDLKARLKRAGLSAYLSEFQRNGEPHFPA